MSRPFCDMVTCTSSHTFRRISLWNIKCLPFLKINTYRKLLFANLYILNTTSIKNIYRITSPILNRFDNHNTSSRTLGGRSRNHPWSSVTWPARMVKWAIQGVAMTASKDRARMWQDDMTLNSHTRCVTWVTVPLQHLTRCWFAMTSVNRSWPLKRGSVSGMVKAYLRWQPTT